MKCLYFLVMLSKATLTLDLCLTLGGKILNEILTMLLLIICDFLIFRRGLVLLALTFGLYLSMHTNLSEKYLWSMLGFSSSMGLMFLPEWYGFVCGK